MLQTTRAADTLSTLSTFPGSTFLFFNDSKNLQPVIGDTIDKYRAQCKKTHTHKRMVKCTRGNRQCKKSRTQRKDVKKKGTH